MKDGAINLHFYPVITEITRTKQIPILHISFTDESESNGFLVNKNLSDVCSTDEDESKGIIVDESSTEKSK